MVYALDPSQLGELEALNLLWPLTKEELLDYAIRYKFSSVLISLIKDLEDGQEYVYDDFIQDVDIDIDSEDELEEDYYY